MEMVQCQPMDLGVVANPQMDAADDRNSDRFVVICRFGDQMPRTMKVGRLELQTVPAAGTVFSNETVDLLEIAINMTSP